MLCLSLVAWGGACSGGSDDEPPDVTIWAPAGMGVSVFWDMGVEEGFAEQGLRAVLEEQELAYLDIEPALRQGIGSGDFEADFVFVPWGMGRRLLAEGLLTEPHAEIFSSDDPDEAAKLFGMIIAAPAATTMSSASQAAASDVEFEHGCLTPASRERLLGTTAKLEPVSVRDDEPIFAGADLALVDGVSEALEKQAVEIAKKQITKVIQKKTKAELSTLVKNVTLELIDLVAKKKGTKLGAQVAARALAIKAVTRAFLVLNIALTVKDVIAVLHASYETSEAIEAAYESGEDTYAEVLEGLLNERADLFEIHQGVLRCDLSGEDALVELDASNDRMQTYANVGRTVVAEMVTISGEDFVPSHEHMDNLIARYLEANAEIRAAARAKIESMTGDDLASTGTELIADDPMTPEPDWETFAKLLTGLDPDNPFTHSNGQLMTMATGPTDLVLSGGAMLEVSASAVEHLFGGAQPRFPCGPGPIAITLCGSMPFSPGPAFVIGVATADDIPVSDTMYDYQYGFVFDADADPANNYQAPASYPKDLFDDTDRWWEVGHDAMTDAWTLEAKLARDGSVSMQQTAARAIMNGNSIMFLVPAVELESPMPPLRTTAFRHTGDFGLEPPHDFNGDVHPLVDEPLAELSASTFTAADGQ